MLTKMGYVLRVVAHSLMSTEVRCGPVCELWFRYKSWEAHALQGFLTAAITTADIRE
jgi:hypothetical protein